MERLSGIVHKSSRHVIDYSTSRRRKTKMHVSRFELAGRTVMFESNKPQPINDGDLLVVAGTVRNGALVALAYRNGISGEVGCQNLYAMLLAGVPAVNRIRRRR